MNIMNRINQNKNDIYNVNIENKITFNIKFKFKN